MVSSSPLPKLQSSIILLLVVCLPWCYSIFSTPVDSGDGAVYLSQAIQGDLSVRTIHIGYLWMLQGCVSLGQLLQMGPEPIIEGMTGLFLVLSALCVGVLGRFYGGSAALAMFVFLSAAPVLLEVGRVEVYLPQLMFFLLALTLWSLCSGVGGALGAGIFLSCAVLVSPITLLWTPLFLSRRRQLGSWVIFGAVALLPIAVMLSIHHQDYFWGPRGLLMAVEGDRSLFKGAISVLKSLTVQWPLALPLCIVGGQRLWTRGRDTALFAMSLLTLLLVMAASRYSDVPLFLPLMALGAVMASNCQKAGYPLSWWLMAGLVLQLIVADTQVRKSQRADHRYGDSCTQFAGVLGPQDVYVGQWGDVKRVAWCLTGSAEDSRGMVWTGHEHNKLEQLRKQGRHIWWLPFSAVKSPSIGPKQGPSELIRLGDDFIERWPAYASQGPIGTP